jgi:putative Holliday junction resolvase
VRALGLDVGSKTIGVAVSDELGMLAHPRKTIARAGNALDVEAVATVLAAEEAERVIVGLPLTLEGEIGTRAKRVEVFVAALRKRLGEKIPVDTWDERFSTTAVQKQMIEAELKRSRRKELVDSAAAAFILQGWLDSRRTEPSVT